MVSQETQACQDLQEKEDCLERRVKEEVQVLAFEDREDQLDHLVHKGNLIQDHQVPQVRPGPVAHQGVRVLLVSEDLLDLQDTVILLSV